MIKIVDAWCKTNKSKVSPHHHPPKKHIGFTDYEQVSHHLCGNEFIWLPCVILPRSHKQPTLEHLRFTQSQQVFRVSQHSPLLIVQHLDPSGTNTKILFWFSFISALLQDKIFWLSMPESTCRWIPVFLSSGTPHVMRRKHVLDWLH